MVFVMEDTLYKLVAVAGIVVVIAVIYNVLAFIKYLISSGKEKIDKEMKKENRRPLLGPTFPAIGFALSILYKTNGLIKFGKAFYIIPALCVYLFIRAIILDHRYASAEKAKKKSEYERYKYEHSSQYSSSTQREEEFHFGGQQEYGNEYDFNKNNGQSEKNSSQGFAESKLKNMFFGMSEEEAKKKYRELMKKFHPDNDPSESAAKKVQEINLQYTEYKERFAK